MVPSGATRIYCLTATTRHRISWILCRAPLFLTGYEKFVSRRRSETQQEVASSFTVRYLCESSIMTQSQKYVIENWIYDLLETIWNCAIYSDQDSWPAGGFEVNKYFLNLKLYVVVRYLCSLTSDLTIKGTITQVVAGRYVYFESKFSGIVKHVWLSANCAWRTYLPTQIQLRYTRLAKLPLTIYANGASQSTK